MLCLSGFELYSRWVPLTSARSSITGRPDVTWYLAKGWQVFMPKMQRMQECTLNTQDVLKGPVDNAHLSSLVV